MNGNTAAYKNNKGLLQNSPNKNEIDFPERGCLSHFLLEAETVMNQLQQERYTGKGGIYSTRKLELACRKNIDFIWLLQGEKVPDYSSFARFRSGKAKEVV